MTWGDDRAQREEARQEIRQAYQESVELERDKHALQLENVSLRDANDALDLELQATKARLAEVQKILNERDAALLLRVLRRIYVAFGAMVDLASRLLRSRRRRMRAQIEAIGASGLFDADWYLRRYPELAVSGVDPLVHYVRYGAREGRDPNPLFDTHWYLKQCRDVAAAGVNPLLHYVKHGATEGRDPHRLFATRWYLTQNPEVAMAGVNPLAHYLHKGQAEGRAPFDPNAAYGLHVLGESQRLAIEVPEILRHIDVMLYKPTFIVMIEGSPEGTRERTTASLERQVYPHWSAVDAVSGAPLHELAKVDDDSFLVWIKVGDVLNERALYSFARALNVDPSTDLVYADEDRLDRNLQRSKPFYKPDWSPDYLESFNYIGGAACFRGSVAAKYLPECRGYYDFVLRLTEHTDRILHIREVLYHRDASAAAESSQRATSDIEALQGRLQRTGRRGRIAPMAGGLGCYDVRISLSSSPLVSVVIPTAGKTVHIDGRQVDLLLNCLDTISARSSYKRLEFVIVDNGDLDERKLEALRQRDCRIVTYTERRFNISKKLNLGASLATGEMLLLLNDDIEPISPDWIERLLEHFEKPHVGVVGAKLLYPDSKIQHAGIVFTAGKPDHVRRFYPRDDVGYFFSTCAARNLSAVTGACMMTRADVYRSVGGYNESLAVGFNDVDYCLKMREHGLAVVYVPGAELTHFEAQSRVPALAPAEHKYFHRRWAYMLTADPFYNEDNLTVAPPTFEVRHNPRQL